jgi:arylsulfatase A-like enzyme
MEPRFFNIIILSLCIFSAKGSYAEQKRPNVLFILTDDQRWDTLGCYGNQTIKTPNLDKLAADGARLDAFYVATPLCCPSRANFLTGFYGHQINIIANEPVPDIPVGTKTIANYLNEAGYVTGFIGKAHLGGKVHTWGFKHYPIVNPGGQMEHKNPNLKFHNYPPVKEGYVTNIFMDGAIDFIRKHQKEEWFLWLATTAPHEPYLDDPKYNYDPLTITVPPGWPPGFNLKKEVFAKYYGTITMADEQIGRVLAELDRLGLSNQTFVMMASDNGYMFGSHKVGKKYSWYEGSARVPALVRWPGKIPKGTKVSHLISNIDFVPTILNLAGASPPKALPGTSFLPAVTSNQPVRKELFCEASHWVMVRQGKMKYVIEKGKGEYLWDIQKDVLEMENLVNNKKYSEPIAVLKKAIEEWMKSTPEVPGVEESLQLRYKKQKKESSKENDR